MKNSLAQLCKENLTNESYSELLVGNLISYIRIIANAQFASSIAGYNKRLLMAP
jgi:hypothetical protein